MFVDNLRDDIFLFAHYLGEAVDGEFKGKNPRVGLHNFGNFIGQLFFRVVYLMRWGRGFGEFRFVEFGQLDVFLIKSVGVSGLHSVSPHYPSAES